MYSSFTFRNSVGLGTQLKVVVQGPG
jgi:hypothetical protein